MKLILLFSILFLTVSLFAQKNSIQAEIKRGKVKSIETKEYLNRNGEDTALPAFVALASFDEKARQTS